MSNLAIRAENLGKKYVIGQAPNSHPTLRDFVSQMLRGPFVRLGNVLRGQGAHSHPESLWALKDVSFEIEEGTVVGLIGRNGSGKSTLLKILSRITDPHEGWADIHGRVGSLLEVGTGFHPNLTGRENIYMSGSMLGMRRLEIEQRFDEIVAFAEVEHFLDTPVKHYSSGMYMRLAFAVAAHLDSEILIVDEVLSVGDLAFQKKCLNKLETVCRDGRTVLMVTHSLDVIKSKCRQCIWLDRGRVVQIGRPSEVVDAFEQAMNVQECIADKIDRKGTGAIRFLDVDLQNNDGDDPDAIVSGDPIDIVIRFQNRTNAELGDVVISFFIKDASDNRVTTLTNRLLDQSAEVGPGAGRAIFRVPRWPLAPGQYSYGLLCEVDGAIADSVPDAGKFAVRTGDFYGCGTSTAAGRGTFLVDFSFEATSSLPLAA